MKQELERRVRKRLAPVHRWSRGKKTRFVLDLIAAHEVESVLVVGVANSRGVVTDNIIEHSLVKAVPRLVAVGMEEDDGEGRWPHYVQADGRDLPWGENEFDLVFSNAVIEHVGQEDDQRKFLAEHARVGRHWVATTPNRAFPVETHGYTLFTHWSDRWYGTRPGVTRLLTPRDLRELLPAGGRVRGGWGSLTLTAHSPLADGNQ